MDTNRYPMLFDNYGDMLTVEQLAKYLSVSKNTVYKLLRVRKIKAKRVGKDWRIPTIAVAEYFEK